MKTVHVHIPPAGSTKYDIRIGPGLLGQLGEWVKPLAPAPMCGVITDSNVAPKYLATARESLSAAGYRVIEHVIPAGEQHKNIQTAIGALDKLLHARVERSTPVIALGGGVVGDLAGFVAATLLRGVPFVQVPTTLLAAVDASVGGKVGIDHAAGKNLIGAFHQPRLVATDISTFATLPVDEIRGGLAECIKHGVIRDADLFAFIAGNVGKIVTADPATMEELVTRNVKIKAAIVEEDPFEHGVRALLNFGHTFGHAMETVLNYSGITHGQAVAAGMTAASRLAHKLGRFPQEELCKLLGLLDTVELPTCCLNIEVDKVLAAMWTDKKVKSGQIRLILPSKIGHAEVVTGVAEADLRWAIESLRQPIVAEKRQ